MLFESLCARNHFKLLAGTCPWCGRAIERPSPRAPKMNWIVGISETSTGSADAAPVTVEGQVCHRLLRGLVETLQMIGKEYDLKAALMDKIASEWARAFRTAWGEESMPCFPRSSLTKNYSQERAIPIFSFSCFRADASLIIDLEIR